MRLRVLRSGQDASVNFVSHDGLEARYVRRTPERVIVYLSAQTGCRQGCVMCWLTAQNQREDRNASVVEILAQAKAVLNHYDEDVQERGIAREIHFNFMARGEPLASSVIREELPEIVGSLAGLAGARGLPSKILISTIIPRLARKMDLVKWVGELPVEIYWSWYSPDPAFRREWLPGADDPVLSMDRIAELSRATNKPARIHFPLIGGENDSLNNAVRLVRALEMRRLRAKINLIHYNAPPGDESQESSPSIYEAWSALLGKSPLVEKVQIVPRVGPDVAASCGMFLSNDAT